MSVLIKGMDMPRRCYDCDYYGWSNFRQEDVCILTGSSIKYVVGRKGRCEDCPLVEVPTPHGRLVDIDKLDKDKMESDNPVMYMTVNGIYIEAVSLNYLDSLPTVVEAEVEE